MSKLNERLHWTTLVGEKILLAIIGILTIIAAGLDILEMYESYSSEQTSACSDATYTPTAAAAAGGAAPDADAVGMVRTDGAHL